MVVDSSAVFAVAFNEPERVAFVELLLASRRCAVGAPTLLECRIVAQRRSGRDWNDKLQAVLDRFDFLIVPFGAEHAAIAAEAFGKYGKGLNRAGLNYGDCMAYAIAKARNEPLLFKGNDFRATDIVPAV